MPDKIQSSYKSSKNFYDVFITHKTWWSKLYSKIVWKGAANLPQPLLLCACSNV